VFEPCRTTGAPESPYVRVRAPVRTPFEIAQAGAAGSSAATARAAITRQSRERSRGGHTTAFGCSARVAGAARLEDGERRLEDGLAGLYRGETAL
jgi:hypothetical protein